MRRKIRGAPRQAGSTAGQHREDLLFESVENIEALLWRHLVTARTDSGDPTAPATAGYTTWIATLPAGGIAALSWEWVYIDPGVVTVGNLLQIASNLFPTDEAGTTLRPEQRLQVLARVLSKVHWYEIVRDFAC